MKKRIRINYIHTAALRRASHVFWKEGPLLFDLAHIVPVPFRESKLPRLFSCKRKSAPIQCVEYNI